MTNEQLEKFMIHAIGLSRSAAEKGNHPFGSLLVRNGEIVLESENTVNTDNDPTRHAELKLVSQASRKFKTNVLKDSTLFTSTEPCPMCSGAIYWAGINRVVFGCTAKELYKITGGGLSISCNEILSKGKRSIEVIGPILESEAMVVQKDFWKE
jgi:tRNA(Arg) A34 adenosine deaminase TadA